MEPTSIKQYATILINMKQLKSTNNKINRPYLLLKCMNPPINFENHYLAPRPAYCFALYFAPSLDVTTWCVATFVATQKDHSQFGYAMLLHSNSNHPWIGGFSLLSHTKHQGLKNCWHTWDLGSLGPFRSFPLKKNTRGTLVDIYGPEKTMGRLPLFFIAKDISVQKIIIPTYTWKIKNKRWTQMLWTKIFLWLLVRCSWIFSQICQLYKHAFR